MINYFNDVGAGIMIPAFSCLLFTIHQKKCPTALTFYLLLAVIECVVWEVLRPYVLMVFNPFDKTPKFLWGDMIAYTIGTLVTYFIIIITYKIMNNEPKRTN